LQTHLAIKLILSTALIYCFISMVFGYTSIQKGQAYAKGKEKAPDLKFFKILSKCLFVFSMCFALMTFWYRPHWTFVWHQNTLVSALGLALVLLGKYKLALSLKRLGENYSPLFDAYFPQEIISSGEYKLIRHPIYLYNLFISFGLAISSGSLWVLLSASIGCAFVLKSIFLEEAYLQKKFADYPNYQSKTWRLIPFIF
jgi:protein-S-isoprenylcysteine O-methyltransferase Ste14